ncbi:hypothetical protein A6E13_16350 [Aliivibrio fischeri]|uniref:host specificity factor TipJ family phage tail protein n=1 Tax=Aliivibrio fischeri TaxID=668 RepID=UPI00080E2089|nr:host specificity factor TipJ family phage tail protein [Aliivibrio fischeri]OCH31793.1 hypothetical protein A6E13_16350 [Aliivibrio fischeri]
MTVSIITYPNKLDKTKYSIDTFKAGQSLTDILSAEVPSFKVMSTPPIWVRLNGSEYPPSMWDTPLKSGDHLDIDVQPKGWELIIAGIIAAVVGAAVASSMAPPDNYSQTTPDGSPIYDTNTQGNQVRLMGIIPELFGTHATYPSLINQAHRYYYDDDEYLLLMTMVTRGFVDLPSDKIFVGNTPVSNYSGDIDVVKFDPGSDVTSHPAHVNTYTSPEVGATSGTSGIELEGAINSITSKKTILASDNITIHQNLEDVLVPFWPIEWEVGQRLNISGTPGAKEVEQGHPYGGWRAYGTQDILSYWSKDPRLQDCKKGDYIQYPSSVDEYGEVTQWTVGVIYAIGTGHQDYDQYYVVRVVNASGHNMPVSTVPSEARYSPIKFLGKDDGTYRITSRTDKNGAVQKLYPNKSTVIPWWSSFTNSGTHSSIRITANESLPGKPIGPFYACPENETTDEIRVDVKYPEGIGYLNDDGSISSQSLRLRIEWRGDGETEWEGINFTRSGATKDQLGSTIPIKLKRHIRPQVRAYRVTGKANDTRTWDTIELVRLKSVLETPKQYHDGTTLAFRIRGTNALSKSAENKLMCVPTRMLHVPNGQGGWTGDDYNDKTNMQPTNDIVSVARYITHQVGHNDEQFPAEEWLALHDILKQRHDCFAAQFDNPDTFWEAMKRVLAPGFSVPTMEFGQIVPIRDQVRTTWDHIYTPDNMTGDGMKMSVKLEDLDDNDGIEVEYFSVDTWKPETVMCLLPGDLGLKPKKLKAFGITDYQKAWVYGMRERRSMKYINTEYSWGTEMDGFNSKYLSYVALSDDVPGYGQTGKLVDYVPVQGGTMLQLDDDLEWESGKTHYLALRKPDGRLSGPYKAIKQTMSDEVMIVGALDFTPDLSGRMEFPFWMFGAGDRWSFPALVTDIKPSGTEKVSMKARNYDPRVYNDDDSHAPEKGYDPVLGMSLTASGGNNTLTTNRSMAYFKNHDQVSLSITNQTYIISSVSSQSLTLNNLDGTAAQLSFSTQPITLTLTARE